MAQALAASSKAASIVNFSAGVITGDASTVTLSLGFIPRFFKIVNVTDVITYEKHEGMVAANCIKTVAAGTLTNDANSLILINSDRTVTISGTLAAAAKALTWVAFG